MLGAAGAAGAGAGDRKELEDAAALLLNLEHRSHSVGGGQTRKSCAGAGAASLGSLPDSLPTPATTARSMDLLATLASLASQKSPIRHAGKQRWQEPEPNQMPIASESVTPDWSPKRRPRSNSEPWAGDWRSVQKETTEAIGSSVVLPFMLEKYADTYNRNGRIGIYTREERDAIIQKFLNKRKRRVWKKKIRYYCRKSLADRRVRVKGRFVKMGVLGDTEMNQTESNQKNSLVDYHDVEVDVVGESDDEPESLCHEDHVKNEPTKPILLDGSKINAEPNLSDASGALCADSYKRPLGLGEVPSLAPKNPMAQSLESSDPPVKRTRRHSIAY